MRERTGNNTSTERNSRFINPYNFVRAVAEVKRGGWVSHHQFLDPGGETLHSGRIACKLTVKTPIFVPDPEETRSDDRERDHTVMRFFRLHGESAIPPTSLKGMIRSVAEAASNSCFSVLHQGKLGIRRLPGWYGAPATLIAGRIEVLPSRPGTTGRIKKMVAYELPHQRFGQYANREDLNGKQIYVTISNKKIDSLYESREQDTKVGYLKTSSRGIGQGNKRHERVFIDPDELKEAELPEDFKPEPAEFDLSYELCDDYSVANKNNRFEHTKHLHVGDPVWFRVSDEGVVKEVGFTQIYRLPFGSSVGDRLPPGLRPCDRIDALCPACRIFGRVVDETVKTGELNALAGKVSFTPAQLVSKGEEVWESVPLAVLSSPKPTFYNFYLFSQEAPGTAVDYDGRPVIDARGNVSRNKAYQVALRGRKFYWHYPDANGKPDAYAREDGVRDKLNGTVELLKHGTFSFAVDFDNLTRYELGLLLYALELDGPDSEMCHKLGMGKPLGLGSVKVTVDHLQLIDRRERYRSILSTGVSAEPQYRDEFVVRSFQKVQTGVQTEDEREIRDSFGHLPYIEDLRVMLAFRSFQNLEVKYPRARGRDGRPWGYLWFGENKMTQLPTTQDVEAGQKTLDGWS